MWYSWTVLDRPWKNRRWLKIFVHITFSFKFKFKVSRFLPVSTQSWVQVGFCKSFQWSKSPLQSFRRGTLEGFLGLGSYFTVACKKFKRKYHNRNFENYHRIFKKYSFNFSLYPKRKFHHITFERGNIRISFVFLRMRINSKKSDMKSGAVCPHTADS